MRSIEHRFDLFPTLEVTVSTMTSNRVTVNRVTVGQARSNQGVVRPALRLTRRGRAVVTVAGVALLLVAVIAAVLLGGGSAAAGDAVRPVPVRQHVVMPGETLWQIAAEVDRSGDPRDTIVRIRELNHLQSAALSVGARLVLPSAD
jgi:LysM domain